MENSYAKIYFINFSDFSIEYISKKIMIFSEKKKKRNNIECEKYVKQYKIVHYYNMIEFNI